MGLSIDFGKKILYLCSIRIYTALAVKNIQVSLIFLARLLYLCSKFLTR